MYKSIYYVKLVPLEKKLMIIVLFSIDESVTIDIVLNII